MVYPLPFCTSGIRFSVYAKYMYFKDELYIRIATFEINNRNNDDLRYCYIYLYSHKPIIATQKEHTTLKRKYNELIYDENISQYLFQQELCLTDVDKVNKISIGNPDAEICLTLIFSPICVSCIKELQKLMPILQRKANTKLDLIFLLDQKKHPESIVIASHILSGYQKNPQLFAMILKKYVDNYPISKNKILHNIKFLDEIPKYEPFINAQEKWCITHKFYTTPILFINGRKFPSYYNIKDIDFLYS